MVEFLGWEEGEMEEDNEEERSLRSFAYCLLLESSSFIVFGLVQNVVLSEIR